MPSWKPLSLLLALAIIAGAARPPVPRACESATQLPGCKSKSFVKGEPVKAFEPGKVYVVEFWATWCGPCLTSIPHLTELHKKNPEITFIGVSTEADPVLVKQFVMEQGDAMNYRVAVDAVPKGKDDGEGRDGRRLDGCLGGGRHPHGLHRQQGRQGRLDRPSPRNG